MRRFLLAFLVALALPALAQTRAPLALEPLPPPPPPAPGLTDADAGAPRVNIPIQKEDMSRKCAKTAAW